MPRKFFFNNLGRVAPKKMHSRAGNFKVNGQMWPEFKIIQDFMPVLVTRKFNDNPTKNKVVIVSTTVTPKNYIKVYGKNFQCSRAYN